MFFREPVFNRKKVFDRLTHQKECLKSRVWLKRVISFKREERTRPTKQVVYQIQVFDQTERVCLKSRFRFRRILFDCFAAHVQSSSHFSTRTIFQCYLQKQKQKNNTGRSLCVCVCVCGGVCTNMYDIFIYLYYMYMLKINHSCM